MEEKTCLLDVRRTPQQKGLLLLFVCSIQSLHDNDCRHDLLLQLFVLGTSAVMKPLLTDPLLHEQVTHLRLWRHKLSESQFKNFWCGCFCLFENRWFFPKMLALLLPVNVRLIRGTAWGHERRKKPLTTTWHQPKLPEFKKTYLRW